MEAPERREEQRLLEQLRAMGLEPETLPGGRTATATLAVSDEPFDGIDAPQQVKWILFASVGGSHIKCLEPRCFFHLPLLDVSGCAEPADIESVLRAAWSERVASLRRARREFERMGVACHAEDEDAVLAFDLEIGDPHARGRTLEFPRIILPGRGPLSGHSVADPAERVFAVEPDLDSGLDLQMAITTRLEHLARGAAQRADDCRAHGAREAGKPAPRVDRRTHRVLMVGPQLAANLTLAESLRMRGYQVVVANTDSEGMDQFCRQSFELLLVDANLGRSDGMELIPAIQTLAGVERLPVVLVDDHSRPALRQKAREIGAVGYLVHPIDVARIAPGLARLLQAPRHRRYSRYTHRVAVRWAQGLAHGFTTAIGRLGMFICTDRESRLHSLDRYELDLSELACTLRVDAETVYLGQSAAAPGIGVRFHGFPDDDEAALIEFLMAIDPTAES